MLQTVRMEKIDETNGIICLVSMSLNCLKKCIFCHFVLASAGSLSLLKQLIYMHLKGLAMHFQKIVLFIMP